MFFRLKNIKLISAAAGVMILFAALALQSAHAETYFSAYDGIEPAKKQAADEGITDAKVVQIFSFRHQDTTYEPKKIIDIDMSLGFANAWFYAFYSEADAASFTIMVTANDTGYTATKVKIQEIDPKNNFYPFLKKPLSQWLIDSDVLPPLKINSKTGIGTIGEKFTSPDVIILTGTDSLKTDCLPDTTKYAWIVAFGSKDAVGSWDNNKAVYIDAETSLAYFCGSATGLNENNTVKQNECVYPNPADDYLYISLDDGQVLSSYSVFNSLGEEVMPSKSAGNMNAIRTAELPAGLYFLRINEKSYPFVVRH